MAEQLRIVDHQEWWIIREDGYGAHDIVHKAQDPDVARDILSDYRERRAQDLRTLTKVTFHVQEITVHREAKVLDW